MRAWESSQKNDSVDFFYFLSSPKKWNMLYCYENMEYLPNKGGEHEIK